MFLKSFAAAFTALFFLTPFAKAEEAKTLRALLLTGGGYHDYNKQTTLLSEGINERIRVEWTVIHKDAEGMKEVLGTKGWTGGFDVVVYNICFANETDAAFVRQVAETHADGTPAVLIHCTMHSYHWKTKDDAWTRFLGITSMRHGKQAPITLKSVQPLHPIMKTLPEEWVTPKEELYEVKKLWDTATVLANGTIDEGKTSHPVVWTNQYGKARVFGTTLAHNDGTMQEKNYVDLLARGILWATGHLDEDGKADAAYTVGK
ncbi:MAG: ThuA domain-containing protein [Luteolibacter sp.]